MENKVSVYLFNQHIADIYQIDDRVYLRQFNSSAHNASTTYVKYNQELNN